MILSCDGQTPDLKVPSLGGHLENAQPVFCLPPFSFVRPFFSLLSSVHCPHLPLLQQGSPTLSTVNTRHAGNWDGRELGFACPLRTGQWRAQIPVNLLSPTAAGVITG